MTNKTKRDLFNKSYDTSNVVRGLKYWKQLLLNKCCNLFIYENLPETLPQHELELALIINGGTGVVKVKDGIYAPITGSLYGYDAYYVPNKFTFSQPVLGSGTYDDLDNCAIVWNTEVDKMIPNYSVLFETIQRYARMLADVESSFYAALVAKRTGRLGVANTSNVAAAVDDVLTKLEMGISKTIVNSTAELNSYQPLNFSDGGSLLEFTQVRDYLLNCFYNEIGLQTLESKRERMITDEINADLSVLDNNIYSMFIQRLKNIQKINKVFDTDIKIKINPIIGGKVNEY